MNVLMLARVTINQDNYVKGSLTASALTTISALRGWGGGGHKQLFQCFFHESQFVANG